MGILDRRLYSLLITMQRSVFFIIEEIETTMFDIYSASSSLLV